MKGRSKLGFDIIGWDDSAVQWCIDNKPTAVEFMLTQQPSPSNVEWIQRLAEASPETIPVIRAYPDHLEGDGNAAAGFEARIVQWTGPFRQHFERVVAHSVNEPVVFNPDMAKMLNDYELGFIDMCKQAGLIPMSFCLSTSHLVGPTLREGTCEIVDWGNLPLWEHMASGVKALSDAGGLLGFNEYGWPDVLSQRDCGYKWFCGKWEQNVEWARKFAGKVPYVGIGEGVLDGMMVYQKPHGYRKIMGGGEYLSQIRKIYDDTYYKNEVAFHLLFSWSPGHHDWASYDVSSMADLLASCLRENPPLYWKGEQGNGIMHTKALDVSEWGGEIEASQWQAAYDAGYRLAIAQAWGSGPSGSGTNDYCAQQLAGARMAGMDTAIYIVIPSDDTIHTHILIQVAKDAAKEEYEHIKFIAMDIEGDELLHPTDPCGRLANAISHAQDKPIVIYTSKYMWEICMGNTHTFSEYPLWDALYDENADLDAGWIPYGGWEMRAIKQYQGTTDIAGISADLNVLDWERLALDEKPEPPPPQPDPIQEALTEIAKAKANVEGMGHLRELAIESLEIAEEKLLGV